MTSTADAHTEQPSLKGKRIAVTGGTTGLGRAIATLLASEGARLFVCGRDEGHLAEGLARIREEGEADGIAIDLAEPANVARFFAAATESLGGLDAVVTNAAIAAEGLADMSPDEIVYAINTNMTAYMLACRHAVDAFGGRAGDIVLIGSMSAHVLGPSSTVYAGIKAGIAGFAEALRRELGPKGIKVGLVEPAKTGSDMTTTDIDRDEELQKIAEHEMLRAEDIAVAVHFMLTQPRRATVASIAVAPRVSEE